jgi:hypothetical protein
MQRLNAIFSFIEHGFLLDEKCFSINEFARARQAAEKQLFEEYPPMWNAFLRNNAPICWITN